MQKSPFKNRRDVSGIFGGQGARQQNVLKPAVMVALQRQNGKYKLNLGLDCIRLILKAGTGNRDYM